MKYTIPVLRKLFRVLINKKLPAEENDRDINSDFAERFMFVAWESLPQINLISNNWKLIFVSET